MYRRSWPPPVKGFRSARELPRISPARFRPPISHLYGKYFMQLRKRLKRDLSGLREKRRERSARKDPRPPLATDGVDPPRPIDILALLTRRSRRLLITYQTKTAFEFAAAFFFARKLRRPRSPPPRLIDILTFLTGRPVHPATYNLSREDCAFEFPTPRLFRERFSRGITGQLARGDYSDWRGRSSECPGLDHPPKPRGWLGNLNLKVALL